MSRIHKDTAVARMVYHLDQQDEWQLKVAAREAENLAHVRKIWHQGRRMRSRISEQTPEEYYVARFNKEDWWLKQLTDSRNHHQTQALMWAAAAAVLAA